MIDAIVLLTLHVDKIIIFDLYLFLRAYSEDMYKLKQEDVCVYEFCQNSDSLNKFEIINSDNYLALPTRGQAMQN